MPPRGPQASIAIENYLKTIYSHTEWGGDAVTPSELAGKLGLAPSSVTEMVKKLAEQGLVDHAPYGRIQLTAAGRTQALLVLRRHRLIECFLVQELGYDWDEVHEEAEHLEHAVSERFLDAIDRRLGFPSHDPHGDAIPAADGTVARPAQAIALRDALPGQQGRVLRISDTRPEVLRRLSELGIGLGSTLRILAAGPVVATERGDVELADAQDVLWLTLH